MATATTAAAAAALSLSLSLSADAELALAPVTHGTAQPAEHRQRQTQRHTGGLAHKHARPRLTESVKLAKRRHEGV